MEMAGSPKSVDQKLVNAVVDAMDPITLWRWKRAVDERLKRDHGMRSDKRRLQQANAF